MDQGPHSDPYRHPIEAILDGAVILDAATGNILQANNAAAKILNFASPEEMVGLNPLDYVPDEDRQPIAVLLAQGLEMDRPSPAQIRVRTKDGRLVWVSVTSALTEHDGKKAALISVREIATEQDKEDALREAAHQYRSLFETMLDGAVVLDTSTSRVVMANRAAANMFGFASPGEMAGQNPLDYVPEEDRENVVRLIADSIERGYLPSTEIRMRNKDGRRLWVSVSASLTEHAGKKATLATVRDITSDKEREAALREAESRYEHLFEGMLDGAVVLDISSFHIVYANRAAAEMFGFESPREVVGENPLNYVPPEDRDNVARMIALNLEGKGLNPAEIRVVTKDKRTLWISATATKVDYEGRTATLTTLRDITADKVKDAALRAAEESRLRLMDAASEAITIVQDGKLVYVNPALARGAGVSEEQLIGLPFLDLVHPDEKQAVWQRYERILAGDWPSEIATIRGVGAAGETMWAEVREIPFMWLGEPAVMSLIHNITEEVKAHEAMKASEERFRSLIEKASEGIAIVDANGMMVYESPSCKRLTGYEPEEVVGKALADFLDPNDLPWLAEAFESVKRQPGTTVGPIHLRFRHRDGTWHTAECQGRNLLNDPSVQGVIVNYRDVTDRLKMEEALKASEERFRTLIERATDVVIVLDATGRITYQSPSLERVTGFGHDEWVGRPLDQLLIHPDDMPVLANLLQQILMQPGSTFEGITVRYQHKDRSWHTLEATVTNMLHDPKVNGLVANFRDITDRKLAQQALQESEQKYRLLVENSTDVIFSLDAQGSFTYVSPAIERMSGYKVDEVVGISFARFVLPEDLPSLMASFEKTLGGASEPAEFRALTKDGSVRQVCTTSRVTMRDGEVTGVTGVMSDITERKEAESALRASEERNRLLVENASEVIAVVQDGLLRFVNPKVTDFLGYLPEELVSRSFAELVHPDDRQMVVDKYGRRLRGEQVPNSYQFRVTDKKGDVKWAEISVALFEWGGRPASLALLNDITERKQADAALREAKEFAENVIRTANVLVVTLDLDGRVTLLNEAGEKITGYRQSEVLGKNWFEVVVPRERYPTPWEEFSRIKAAGKVIDTFENPILTKWGEERIVSWKNSALVVNDKIVGTLSFGTDITKRKQAEEALKESEAKYKRLFESTQTAMEVISMETGLVVLANEATARMFGFASANDLVGEDSMKYLRPEDVGWVAETMAQAVTDSSWREIAELQVRTKDGRWLWISGTVRQSEYQGKPALLVSLLDITSRKQAELTLHESEDKYRLLTEKTNDIIYTTDLDFNNTYVSPSVERILGFTPEDYLGRSPDQRMTLESLARATETLLEHLSLEKDPNADPNRTVRIELEFYHKDGSTVWLEHQVSGLRDASGTIIGLHGVARDIRERRKAEQALTDSEAVYKRLFEHTQTAMEVISGETGLVVLANETTARMFGFASADDLIGVDSMEYLLPEDRDRVATQMALALADKTWSQGTELHVRTKDGRLLWINGLVTTTEYQGKPALLISLVDLTARKQVEETLQASEQKYRFLAEKTNDVIWTADLNLRTSYVSPSVEKVLGFTPEERLAHDAAQQMTPESFARAAEALSYHLALEQHPDADPNRVLRIELEYYRKDGSTIWLENQVSGIRDAGGNLIGLHGVARDVSERKRAEHALNERLKELQCIAGISRLAEKPDVPIDDFVREAVDLLPPAWQYPDICGARVMLDSKEFSTPTFRETEWIQSADIKVDGKKFGTIAVCYLKEMPRADEGPFLKEERDLIDTIADFLGHVFQHRQMEQHLRASEQRYRLIADNSMDIIWVVDAGLKISYSSPSATALLGYQPEDFTTLPFNSLLTPDSFAHVAEVYRDAVAGEKSTPGSMNDVTLDIEVVRKDGSTVWLEAAVTVVRDEQGRFAGFQGACRDITERRRARQALKESEEYFRTLIEESSDAIAILDGSGKLVYESPSMERVTGHRLENWQGTAVGEWLLHPDDLAAMASLLERLLTHPEVASEEVSVRFKHKDGTWHYLEGTVRNLLNDPKVGGLVINYRDVTERRQAEEVIRESERKFRALFESANDGIFIHGLAGPFLEVNEVACRQLGYTREELLSLTPADIDTPEYAAEVAGRIEELVRNGQAMFETAHLTKDGRIIPIEASSRIMNYGGRPAVLTIARDISERKQAEEEIRRKTEQLDGFFNVALDLLCIAEADGRFNMLNRAWERTLGHTREALMAARFYDYIHPGDIESTQEAVSRLASGKEVTQFINRYRCHDGSYRWLEWHAAPLGKLIYAAARDVTEQKDAQEALAASEASYKNLFEQTMLGMEVVDGQTGKVLLANHAIARMFGFDSPEEMVGLDAITGWVMPEDMEWVLEGFAQAMANPDKRDVATLRVKGKDGRIVWVTGSGTLLDYEGKPAILISLVDVTAARVAQEKLSESEEKNRLLIDNASEAIAVIQDGIAKFFNRRLVEITGWTTEDLLSKSFLDLVHPDERDMIALNYMRRIAGEEVPNNYQFRIIDKDGNTKWLQINAVRFDWEGKPATLDMFSDVTERVKAELALRESEERFRTLIEEATDAVAVLDAAGNVRYYTPSMLRVTGYKPGEWVDKSLSALLLHPDDLPKLASILDQVLKEPGAAVENFTTRYQHPDGTWHVLEATARNMLHDPKIGGIVANFRDVTQRVEAEQALKESEERYRLLADNSSDVIWLFDANLKLVYASPSVATVLGYSVEEVAGIGLDKLLTSDSLAMVTEKYAEALARDSGPTPSRTTRTLEVEMVRKDGSILVVEAVTTAMHDSEGRLVGFQGACRDITERVKAEEALRNSEERFRGLVETTSDWVWEIDHNSRYTYVSPKVRDVLGYEPEELLGHTPFQFMHQREGRRVSKIVKRFAAAQLPLSLLENTCVHKDGHAVVMETSAVPIIGSDGEFLGYRGIDRDITERKKAEQELQRSLKRLEKTMESTIEAITNTIETRDPYTTGHQMRVTELACGIAKVMELPPTQIEGIRVAGLLHDIGKIAIPTEILSKPGKLNEVEYEMIKTHSKVGYNILKKIEFPWPVARTVLQHHERWNGSGYPHGIRGDDILIEARILAVADVVEAMSSHRPYRPTVGADKALEEISRNSGILYDPAVAAACVATFTQVGFKFASSPGGAAGETDTISAGPPAQYLEES